MTADMCSVAHRKEDREDAGLPGALPRGDDGAMENEGVRGAVSRRGRPGVCCDTEEPMRAWRELPVSCRAGVACCAVW